MYIPDWESLADALSRVLATGIGEQDARRQICQAVNDGAIGVRVRIAATDKDIPNRERSGQTVRPPSMLKPDDLDWQSSRPLRPWMTGPDPVERYSMIGGPSWDWALRAIATVELFTDQVIRIFPPSPACEEGRAIEHTSGPETADAEGWSNLWLLAKKLAPKTCSFAMGLVSGPSVHIVAMERAKAVLMLRDPSVIAAVRDIRSKLGKGDDESRAVDAVWVNPALLALLRQETERQMERRRTLGRFLLASVIPDRLRRLLLRGGYEVIARTTDDQDVSLSTRDLVGLEIDLANNALSGDGTVYSAVRVRPTSRRERCGGAMFFPSLPPVPPEWVPLADLPAWVACKYDVADNVVATDLILGVRHNELRHRVCGIRPNSAVRRWPAGVTEDLLHDKIQRVFINDWEAAETDWRLGTVGGWGPPGAREQLPIEVEWFSVKLFSEIRARGKWRKAAEGASPESRQPDAEAFASTAPTQPLAASPPRKRRTNGLDHRTADAPLVAEMHLMIGAGTARSPEQAARSFTKRAAGAGCEESKVKRLAKRYRQSLLNQS